MVQFLSFCQFSYGQIKMETLGHRARCQRPKISDNRKKLQTRSIQRMQTPTRLWPLTLSCDLDLKSRFKKSYVIRCIVLYLGTRCDICECNSLRNMTISSFLWPLTFTCDLHRTSRSLSFLSLDRRYAVVYWFQVRSL